MYSIDYTGVIAIALVALVIIFIRISLTLKDISEALVSRGASPAAPAATVSKAVGESRSAVPAEAGTDETELAAVIAIAQSALRAAV